jgi:hypothetical protein
MRVSWRVLAARETDHELIWSSVSLGALAAAAIWFSLHLPWPPCMFLAVTGHPCVTCGATRSAIAFFHGQFLTAWKWNPLVFALFCGITVFDIYALIVLVTRAPRLRVSQFTALEKNLGRLFVLALLALNWIYLLAHWRNFS